MRNVILTIRSMQANFLRRYLDSWYEIARLDHAFKPGLSNVSATYHRRDDGGVQVLNRGYDDCAGIWQEAEGRT